VPTMVRRHSVLHIAQRKHSREFSDCGSHLYLEDTRDIPHGEVDLKTSDEVV
jgi:hypothetical protein